METEKNTNGKTEIVKVEQRATLAYEPRNYEEAMKLAIGYANSGLLGALKSPEAVFLMMATGAELGISPTAALRSIHIIQGKPVLSADLIVALCLRSPLCEYFTCTETTGERATYETKRRGAGPVCNTFTMEDAKRAGLSGKDNYKNYGQAMLRHRAAAELARMAYPDLVLGVYAEEEMIGVTNETPAIAPAPAPQDVIDGELVKAPPAANNLERWCAGYAAAASKGDCDKIDAEIAKAGLDKQSDDYKTLVQARKEAVARVKL